MGKRKQWQPVGPQTVSQPTLRNSRRVGHPLYGFVNEKQDEGRGTRRSERGSVSRDAVEDDGCQRATSEVCGGSFSAGEALQPFVSGVWDKTGARRDVLATNYKCFPK